MCYEITKDSKTYTVAVIGRCGGYAQCQVDDPGGRDALADKYKGVSKKLPMFPGSGPVAQNVQTNDIANADGNACLTTNPSAVVTGTTSVCMEGMNKKDYCLDLNDKTSINSCGESKDKLCNVDWCSSNLHPHFDLDKQLIDQLGFDGSGFIDKVEPVQCPKPFRLHGNAMNPHPTPNPACTGTRGKEACTCRGMEYADLGKYGGVCIVTTPACNQTPWDNGLASKGRSDRCPIGLGECQNDKCVPSDEGKAFIKKYYDADINDNLISTFPQPSVTEYCDLGSGGCGGWDVACHVPELACDPSQNKPKQIGEKCNSPDQCSSYNCCWHSCTVNGKATDDTGVCADPVAKGNKAQDPCGTPPCEHGTSGQCININGNICTDAGPTGYCGSGLGTCKDGKIIPPPPSPPSPSPSGSGCDGTGGWECGTSEDACKSCTTGSIVKGRGGKYCCVSGSSPPPPTPPSPTPPAPSSGKCTGNASGGDCSSVTDQATCELTTGWLKDCKWVPDSDPTINDDLHVCIDNACKPSSQVGLSYNLCQQHCPAGSS